ncbi:MAG: hypothetical protein R3F16_02945 [Myxococcota bacterium]
MGAAVDARGAGTQAHCTPSFPDTDGWSGGDAAWSVPLAAPDPVSAQGAGRSVWLFGDSFVARGGTDAKGRAYPFVHNSIAISTCTHDGRFRLEPHWRVDEDGAPIAFFEPPRVTDDAAADAIGSGLDRFDYYWPLDAFLWRGELYVALLCVAKGPPRGPFQLPFRLTGVDLARIENPAEPPASWRIRHATLARGDLAFPGAAFVVARDHLYAFTFLDEGDGHTPRILTRLALAALEDWPPDLSPALETWTDAEGWQPGLRPKQARILMPDDATESSVLFDRTVGEWLAVYAEPSAASVPKPGAAASKGSTGMVWLRRAARLEGPWSPREPLFRMPELAVEPADPNVFCYAAKAHPQFAREGELLVTWVCNLFGRSEHESLVQLRRLLEREDLYRPHAARLPIPPRPTPPHRPTPAADAASSATDPIPAR